MKNSLERIVIKWASQIDGVLKETSSYLFEDDKNPTPLAELKFWNDRRVNLRNIASQLSDLRIKKIGNILRLINSVYLSTYESILKDVKASRDEVDDITLFLCATLVSPLRCDFDVIPIIFSLQRKPFERIENADFLDVEEKLAPLFHMICKMWAASKYYGSNSRMSVLFRMVNNLMIECATKHLDPESLFQGNPDESLLALEKVLSVLKTYKACFTTYRDKLSSFVLPNTNPMMWTFDPEEVFNRFDLFTKRLLDVLHIIKTGNDLFKVEKIEIGGLKGQKLSRGVQEIYSESMTNYAKWSQIQFDPLDPSPKLKHFERERNDFKEKVAISERKLASICVEAFDECYSIESLMKLTAVCGPLLRRPIIFKEVREKINMIVELYHQDLCMVKVNFDRGFEQLKAGQLKVESGFPPISGALVWINKMRRRITIPIENLLNFEFKEVFESEEGKYAIDRYNEFIKLLDAIEKEIFEPWKEKTPNEINLNMKKNLLMSIENERLKTNFDAGLVTALSEVKHMRAMDKKELPDVAIELFEVSNELWVSSRFFFFS